MLLISVMSRCMSRSKSMVSAVSDFYHDNSMALDCMLIQLLPA